MVEDTRERCERLVQKFKSGIPRFGSEFRSLDDSCHRVLVSCKISGEASWPAGRKTVHAWKARKCCNLFAACLKQVQSNECRSLGTQMPSWLLLRSMCLRIWQAAPSRAWLYEHHKTELSDIFVNGTIHRSAAGYQRDNLPQHPSSSVFRKFNCRPVRLGYCVSSGRSLVQSRQYLFNWL